MRIARIQGLPPHYARARLLFDRTALPLPCAQFRAKACFWESNKFHHPQLIQYAPSTSELIRRKTPARLNRLLLPLREQRNRERREQQRCRRQPRSLPEHSVPELQYSYSRNLQFCNRELCARPGLQLRTGGGGSEQRRQVLCANQNEHDPFDEPNTSVTPWCAAVAAISAFAISASAKSTRRSPSAFLSAPCTASPASIQQARFSSSTGIDDSVSLNDNVQVQRDTLAAARRLHEDDQPQVEQGTLAPLTLS